MKATDIAWHLFNMLCLIFWIVNIIRWARSGFKFPRIINWCAMGGLLLGVIAIIVFAIGRFLNWKLALTCILLPPLVAYFVWFFILLAPSEEDMQKNNV